MTDRRWIVVGAGAVGGTIGGRLHQAGAEVCLVARGAHGTAIQADGLLLRDPDGEVRLPIPCASSPADVDWRAGDAVVLATKTQDATTALDAIASASGVAVPVVCATNGLEAERLALRRFEGVHGMCVVLPAAHLVPGVVDAFSAPCPGLLDVGLAVDGTDEVDHQLVASLEAAGFDATADDDVMRRKRDKLLLNLANVLDAACGPDPGIGPLADAARAEAVAVFDAAGLTRATDADLAGDQARRAARLHLRPIAGERRGGGSTWQSLARGTGATEADYLNGEIALLGRQAGVATPVNVGLQRLARHLAAAGATPGSMTAAEVEAWVGAGGGGRG
jgi:2-dehydropantoate 2-reductase